MANREWIHVTTLAEAAAIHAAAGKVYLPDASYREMTEWVLPVDLQMAYEDLMHGLQHDPRWPEIRRFVQGGFWRNFKVRYPEAERDVRPDDDGQPPPRASGAGGVGGRDV